MGWLACMNGPAPLAYSASLYLIIEAGGALPPDARRTAVAKLDPGVRADLAAIGRRLAEREARKSSRRRRASTTTTSSANRVADGNASYSRALSLILSEPIHGAFDRASTARQ